MIIPDGPISKSPDNDPPNAALSVPNIDGMTFRQAALAYAEAGWFVLPVKPGTKNPGSVVGDGWHHKSSRDPAQIVQWWSTNSNYGIALHAGRSGAVIFDLDRGALDELPSEIAGGLRMARCQLSRRGNPDRGHYLFLNDEGYGNSSGTFRIYGDVRGKNGVIIAAPTSHAEDDGEYRWVSAGPVPTLPDELRVCLTAASDYEVQSLTSAALDAFIGGHHASTEPKRLGGPVTLFKRNVAEGMSRHYALLHSLCMAYREAMTGAYSARDATDRLDAEFDAAFRTVDDAGTALKGKRARPFPYEFQRTAEWAAAAALTSDPDETRARMNRERTVDEDAFWTARKELSGLRDFARARMVAPWAMLGAVLARTISSIPPTVVLPGIVGSYASLNSFFALVGASGAGKGSAERAAADFLRCPTEIETHPVGSGEGLVKQFAHRTKASEEQVNVQNAVLFNAPEVDSIATQNSRSGATLLPQLRSAWSGETLGFSYSDPTKNLRLLPHRYRLCLAVGVQPERAEPLLDDADGGTPQRFVWLPTTDPTAPDRPPECPLGLRLAKWPANAHGQTGDARRLAEMGLMNQPVAPEDLQVLAIPQGVADTIRSHRLAVVRGTEGVDPLDGHRMQCQLKVAAALMYCNGRTDAISDGDWQLAATVMAVSDHTRRGIREALFARAGERNAARGRADGERTVAASEEVARQDQQRLERIAENIVKKLAKAGGKASRSAVRKQISSRDKPHFDEALDLLVADERARIEAFEHNGQPGSRLVLSELAGD